MKSLFNLFSSLKLTVWLLAASLILVFFGTLDQVDLGIYAAQKKYFESFVTLWGYPEQWPLGETLKSLHLPIPGGYLIGPLMLANLLCAHFKFFRPRWSVLGIALIHAGIVSLLISQLATNLSQVESFMWMDEGETGNYTTSFHYDELAVIDTTAPDKNKVVAIPAKLLEKGKPITHPRLPFRIETREYYTNAIVTRTTQGELVTPSATKGLAPVMGLQAREIPPTYRQDERNTTTAVVELIGPDGSLGTWLVSNVFESNLPPQEFEYDGRTFQISLRYQRHYLPFTLTLLDFTHEKYPGTEIPKNFASKVRLLDPTAGEDRENIIYMNHPLRHGGLTFYQASYGPNSAGQPDMASMLQVVRNPSWLVPYIACILVTLGMIWQFGWGLKKFSEKRAAKNAATPTA